MKKRFFVILTVVLIIISSFSFTLSSSALSDNDKLVINIYNNPDFLNIPIFTDYISVGTIYSAFNKTVGFYDDDIHCDGIRFSVTAQTEEYITFDITYAFMLYDNNDNTYREIVHSGNTIYINNADKFDMYYNPYNDPSEFLFGYFSATGNYSLSERLNYNFAFVSSSGPISDHFGNLVLSVIDTDGSSIVSDVINFSDVFADFNLNPTQYAYVNYDIWSNSFGSGSDLVIYNSLDSKYYGNIPDFYFNLTNALSYNKGNKVYTEYDADTGNYAAIDFEVNFYDNYSIEIYVGGSEYESLGSIGMNLYNYNGRVVYGSKIIRGSYIDYSVYITKNYESVDFILNIDGSSEYFSYTISYDLIEDIDYLGLSFTKNNPYPDIAIDKNFDTDSVTLYEGKFIPTGTFDNLNFYIVENGQYEVIKEEISKDFLDKTNNQTSKLDNSVSSLSNQMNNFKDAGSDAANDVLDNVDTFFTGEGANNATEVLNVIYELPNVTTFLFIVLSMALIGYVLFGKKS